MITKTGSSVLYKLAGFEDELENYLPPKEKPLKYEKNIQEIIRRLQDLNGLRAKKYKPIMFADLDMALAKEIRDAHGRGNPRLDGYDGRIYVNNGSLLHWRNHMDDSDNGKTKYSLEEAEKMLRGIAKAKELNSLNHHLRYFRLEGKDTLRESNIWNSNPDSQIRGMAPLGVLRTNGSKYLIYTLNA